MGITRAYLLLGCFLLLLANESVGIVGLPVPEVAAHGLQILRCLETELFLRKSRIGREVRNVPLSAITNSESAADEDLVQRGIDAHLRPVISYL